MDSVVGFLAFAAFVAFVFTRVTLAMAGVFILLGLGMLYRFPMTGCVLVCAGVILIGLCQTGKAIFKDLE